jgi:SAM-dependent methyltransferase
VRDVREVRYDGLADWYDALAEGSSDFSREGLASLLGPGSGLCLDLGCGSGLYLDLIRSTGRSPVGLELSADQLRLARRRGNLLVQADGAALPFAGDVFETVAAAWISTDVEDFPLVMREAARVLRPDGLLVLFGVHPCFNGPCVEDREDGSRIVHPTYRATGRHDGAPWWRPGGIRERVGMRHLPLAELVNGVIDAGLRVSRVVEPRDDPIPAVLAIAARKDAANR